jgi:hypothetical protein
MKHFSLSQQWVLLGIVLLILGSLYFGFLYHAPSPFPEESVKEVVVEVSGEVRSPGVYLFENSPTLREAVDRAGGLKETAGFDIPSASQISIIKGKTWGDEATGDKDKNQQDGC